MIKKRILTLIVVLNLLFTGLVYAQNSSSSADLQDAQTLKDKIASKVAELQKNEQKAVAGTIMTVSDAILKIKNVDNVTYTVKLDKDLTKAFIIVNGVNNDARLNDFKKGDYIIVSGPIDGTTVTANSVYKDEQYFIGSGKITEVNLANYYVKVLTPEKDTYTLDLETFTKRYMLSLNTLTIEITTLSKIKEGDTIHFVYKKTGEQTEPNRYPAQKILIIPQEYFIK